MFLQESSPSYLYSNKWFILLGILVFSVLFLATLQGCFATVNRPKAKSYQGQKGWIIDTTEAKKRHKQGAVFLDLRSASAWKKAHVEGSVHTTWQHFSESKAPNQGRLLQDPKILTERLQKLGISKDKAVIAYADPIKGWGEDGRIVWMLRTFGHTNASIVNGGYKALKEAGLIITKKPSSPQKGNFTIQYNTSWEIKQATLQKVIADPKQSKEYALIDTRELREYKGSTPYGESRGGHVPNAVHIYFKDLIDSRGRLLSRPQLLEKLEQKGVTPDKKVVAYCTGGIRSGWFVAILVDLGFSDARNYAGSMWEWSAKPPQTHPLKKK